ncbi:MAG TPA: SRPBCC family protein [Anaeromyxobacter sp.]|nr:SRPBCC family protein [Anaeromyxobacter sp.]
MAIVTREVVVEAGIEALFDVLVDYPRYPEFVPGIKACAVREVGGEKHVEYELDVGLRRIRYVLCHREERPTRVSWSLVSGDALKVSNGSWELAPEGERTRARYSVDIQLARLPLVPQALVDRMSDQLTRVQLPRTLEAFRARAERR